MDELSVSRCMREQRVLVDMRAVPELYLQIAALSMGIPQIVGSRTQFVKQGRNGIILQDMRKLPAALRFYLDNLVNWNDAKVCSYVLGPIIADRGQGLAADIRHAAADGIRVCGELRSSAAETI